MSSQTVPAHVRVRTRPDMAPIVAARRRRVIAYPVAGRHMRTVAWIALAVGLSTVLAALVAVVAIAAAIGVLPDPASLGSFTSTITDLPLKLG